MIRHWRDTDVPISREALLFRDIKLWETTLNPETRMMKRVEIEDARLASSVTEILMGSDVPPRKKFIYEHAQDAELDI